MEVLSYILQHETARFCVAVNGWEEAVDAAVDLLVKAGAAKREYAQGIFSSVKEEGMYFVLAPSVAMPHARPELGGVENGFALVTLEKPLCFGDGANDPVSVVLAFVAADADTHAGIVLPAAATFVMQEDFLKKVQGCTNLQQLHTLFG